MKQKKKQKAENYEFIPTGKSRKKGLISYFFPALTVIAALLILGCLGLLIYVFVPGGLNPGLGRGKLQVCLEGDQLLLTWPETINASACRIYMYDLEQKDYVLYGEYTGNSLTMEGVRPNQEILLQLQAVRYTVNRMGNPCERMSRKKSVTVRPVHLDRPVLQEELDPQKMNLTVNWNSGTGNLYEVFWLDENDVWQSVRVVGKDSIRLSFGDDIDMPGQERPARVAVRTLRRGDDCVYYSALSDVIVVERDDLSGTLLALSYEEIGDRLYRMSWEETRGDTYEVQQWSERENAWLTRAVLDWSQERVYETDRLPSGTTVRFRVVAYRKDERENEEDFTVQPEVLSFRTGISTLYCTIWPIVNLNLLSDAESNEVVGQIPAGEALCVLAEENGRFRVRYRGEYGYVDSRYCMINLPEYLGDMCEYDIANSYASIFRVHGYDIPGITDTVVKGYQNVCLENHDFLVPYLYPCTGLLLQAAQDVAQDGYRLRIYDAFRPNESTRFLYDTMSGMLRDQVSTQYGMPAEPGEGRMPTFGEVMMSSGYHLSSFLAATVSSHNRGIALDLTLVEGESGEAVDMQSDMHDLSWYSCLSENNEMADLLSVYMKRVGFNGLASEWWHFQDDKTREELKLNTYLTHGVAITGWKMDDTGWRYRRADGSYYCGTTATVEGEICTFDADGYVMGEEAKDIEVELSLP